MHFILAFVLAFVSVVTGFILSDNKTSSTESSANPIAKVYPDSVTGTINGTIAVIPISYELARSLIPSQYGILTSAYESLLPGFPPNSYPVVAKFIIDHDIRLEASDISVPDFQSVHIKFPFVDLLGDGYSNFAWEKYLLLTSTNQVAIDGSAAYGIIPVPATFDPLFEAYKVLTTVGRNCGPVGKCNEGSCISSTAYVGDTGTPVIETAFTHLPSIGPWPLSFYVNVTNQPQFGNGTACDQQITFYNTTLSTGANFPGGVVGKVNIKKPYLREDRDSSFENVFGIKVDVAFIENNFLKCESLKGF